MSQLFFFGEQIWSVTELTRYLRGLLTGDNQLKDIWIQGEVTNLSRPSSGHIYFTLRDASSALKCVMWRSTATRMPVMLRDGDAVEVHGYIDIYEAGGQYQLYVDLIQSFGEGALFQQFLRLKAQLEAEGLFDPQRKRPIPKMPHCIGVVTSPTGAALQDILNTIRRRYFHVKVVIAPTPVQGDEAPAGIVAALEKLNKLVEPDVILVARGGGSMEDLWAFNDEQVAHAIAASKAPVITGIGHETDFTIADFVSDLRAPTPTASAELATPDRHDLGYTLAELELKGQRAIRERLNNLELNLDLLNSQLNLHSPESRVRSGRQRVDELALRLSLTLGHSLKLHQARLDGTIQKLMSLSPQDVLNRGYALVSSIDGCIVKSIKQVEPGSDLEIQVSDGKIHAQVKSRASQ